MFSIGLLVTAVAPTAAAATGLGWALYTPLALLGGIFLSLEFLPAAVRTISNYTPLGAASDAMRDAMLGTFPTATSLLVLAGRTVICGLLAVRFFRWE